MDSTASTRLYGRLIAKAWSDLEFLNRLRADPKAAMKEVGITVPDGIEIQLLEDTATKVHLVVPAKPGKTELSEEDLNKLTWAYESNSGPSGGSWRS